MIYWCIEFALSFLPPIYWCIEFALSFQKHNHKKCTQKVKRYGRQKMVGLVLKKILYMVNKTKTIAYEEVISTP